MSVEAASCIAGQGTGRKTARERFVRRAMRSLRPPICTWAIRSTRRFLLQNFPALVRTSRLPLGSLLMAGELGIPAAKYAALTGNLLRPSTPIGRSPHAALLRASQDAGDELFRPDVFEQTGYYRNAVDCIELFGHYFDVTRRENVVRLAREFVDRFRNGDRAPPRQLMHPDHTPPGRPVIVQPIRYSDCYEIVDGQHRCAMACARGQEEIDAVVEGEAVLTPLQERLLDVLWTDGRRLLQQPVDSPEVAGYWTPVRRCTDRFAMMARFLGTAGITMRGSTFLDIASSYGWFLAEMRKLGFEVQGIERDPVALSLGELVYGIPRDRVTRGDGARILCAGGAASMLSLASVCCMISCSARGAYPPKSSSAWSTGPRERCFFSIQASAAKRGSRKALRDGTPISSNSGSCATPLLPESFASEPTATTSAPAKTTTAAPCSPARGPSAVRRLTYPLSGA